MFKRALYLRELLRHESMPPAALRAYQDRAVRKLVHHAAARVPFYRDLYERSQVSASRFRGTADLAGLPIVEKRSLRAAGAAAMALDAPRERISISTSGSTGEPFEFPIDARYDQRRKAQYLRPYLLSGRNLTDGVLRLTAFPVVRKPWFSRFGLLREVQLNCATEPGEIVATWSALAPQILQGYPSSLRALAHHCLASNERLNPAPRTVFTDSELLTADTRKLIERAFGAPVVDIFGTYETDNIAWQCGTHGCYHVATDCVVLEIVRDGKPVTGDEEGELVVTVLDNHTTPFIRYNLHDRGRWAGVPCGCGSPLPLLRQITGRSDDLIVLPDGRRRSALDILGRLDRFVDAILHYQLRQLTERHFELLIAPSDSFTEIGVERIVNAIDAALGHPQLEVRLVEAIPAHPSGKLRAFVSELSAVHA